MSRRNDEKGYVLVTIALVIVVLAGFTALAVDVGMLNNARTAAQRAADSAALAGAFTFVTSPTAPQPGTAQTHATNLALSNNILGTPITGGNVAVSVNVASRIVTVTITQAQNTFFARVFGQNSATIQASANAEASLTAAGSDCVKPFFIPNTMVSTREPCDACTDGEVLISNGQVTPYGQSRLGLQFTVKPNNPSQALRPGDFYAVELGGSAGGNDYRDNIARCIGEANFCSQTYSVMTGNMVGPTNQGVRNLIGNPSDTYVSVGQYRRPDGTISDTSRSLIIAPVWDVCSFPGFCPSAKFPGGTQPHIQSVGFALVFIENTGGAGVTARLINIYSCAGGGAGGGGGGIDPNEIGPFAVPVRLVRLP